MTGTVPIAAIECFRPRQQSECSMFIKIFICRVFTFFVFFRYLEKLTEELSQKRALVRKYDKVAELMAERQASSAEESLKLQEKLQIAVKRTKELQQQV